MMNSVQVGELLHVHEVVWQVTRISDAAHDVAALHMVRVNAAYVPSISVYLLPCKIV